MKVLTLYRKLDENQHDIYTDKADTVSDREDAAENIGDGRVYRQPQT